MTAALTPERLRRLAGDRSFERGEAYFTDGAVRSLRAGAGLVEARVEGTRTYRVRLELDGGELDHDCSCPMGEEGAFCKHCVAVALAWRAASADGTVDTRGEENLRAYLLGLDKEELAALLLDHVTEDNRLHRKLTLRAARAKGAPTATTAWKQALADALGSGGFVPYREAYDYTRGIDEVIDTLEDLLRDGRAEEAVALAEHGLAEIEAMLESVDDSDGAMGGLLQRLQDIHLAACEQARPDPVNLAERLFEWEMETDYDTFHRAAATYAELLGETGMDTYRRLAKEEWARVPALAPGEEDPQRYGRRFRITTVMETLARLDGDLEAQVAVKSRDLSRPFDFLQIAEVYSAANAPGRALDWAERGWHAFPEDQQDDRLRMFLAEAYQEHDRSDDAMALVWQAFARSPRLETYWRLERHGTRAGEWPAWRDKALARMRADQGAGSPPRSSGRRPNLSSDRSPLVEIFLYEGDVDTAWREAEIGGCAQRLWLALAERRAAAHPEDAIQVYRDHVMMLLEETGNRVYEEAIRYLEKIEALCARARDPRAFSDFVDEIRTAHRRKRNLIAMLDGKGW